MIENRNQKDWKKNERKRMTSIARDLHYDVMFPDMFKRIAGAETDTEARCAMTWCRNHM